MKNQEAMVLYCAIESCQSGSMTDRQTRAKLGLPPLAQFRPRNFNELEIWKAALNQELSFMDCICELHFNKSDLIKFTTSETWDGKVLYKPLQKQKLKPGAVPHLLPVTNIEQNEYDLLLNDVEVNEPENRFLRPCRACGRFFPEANCHKMDETENSHLYRIFTELYPLIIPQMICNPVICDKCLEELKASYDFSKIVQETDSQLKLYLEQNKLKLADLKVLNSESESLELTIKSFLKEPEVTEDMFSFEIDSVEEIETSNNCNKELIEKENRLQTLYKELESLSQEIEDIIELNKVENEDVHLNKRLKFAEKSIDLISEEIDFINNQINSFVKKFECAENSEVKVSKLTCNSCKSCQPFKIPQFFDQMQTFIKTGNVGKANKVRTKMFVDKDRQCFFCGLELLTKEELDEHLKSTHALSSAYLCESCGTAFHTIKALRLHKETCLSEVRNYSCVHCHKILNSKSKLNAHIRGVHLKKRILCNVCGRSVSRSFFQQHSLMHSGVKNFACEQCPKKFATSYLLSRHVNIVHNVKDARYECDNCAERFTRKDYLIKHFWTKHRISVQEWPCNSCNKVFPLSSYLSNHKYHSHGIGKGSYTGPLFKCSFCGKGFRSERALTIHNSKAHIEDEPDNDEGERKFACPNCNKTFTRRKQQMNHMDKEHKTEEGYSCEICSKVFKHVVNLENHVYSTHRQHEKSIPCQHCDRLFATKSMLYKHFVAVHRGSHTCTTCQEVFNTPHQLAKHKKTEHTIVFVVDTE